MINKEERCHSDRREESQRIPSVHSAPDAMLNKVKHDNGISVPGNAKQGTLCHSGRSEESQRSHRALPQYIDREVVSIPTASRRVMHSAIRFRLSHK
jgi:hypothetical protein